MAPRRIVKRAVGVGAVGAGGAALYGLVATGAVTVDLGWGRVRRDLGPLEVEVAAPRQVVFDTVAAPYLHRTPQAMASKLRVLERSADMVLAAHFTPLPAGLRATTVETVRFEAPARISFRLARGPVPHVEETFELEELVGGRSRLRYRGEIGADLWAAGRLWGAIVARKWERTVAGSLEEIRTEAERAAAAHHEGAAE